MSKKYIFGKFYKKNGKWLYVCKNDIITRYVFGKYNIVISLYDKKQILELKGLQKLVFNCTFRSLKLYEFKFFVKTFTKKPNILTLSNDDDWLKYSEIFYDIRVRTDKIRKILK
ncbi:MAG: hypothetical protein BV456_00710 [Thermoplasmata archaeon M8B2D]|nr:MAG: hypothetical protein BV456_00710 [Thermoplasmata archaeon M8B2D]